MWSSGRSLRWGFPWSHGQDPFFPPCYKACLQGGLDSCHAIGKPRVLLMLILVWFKNANVICNGFHWQAVGILRPMSFGYRRLEMVQRWEHVWFPHNETVCATLGDSKVMIHSPLTEKGSASKRDFLRSNLSIISHHSSIWNFFSYRKQIALIFFCRVSPNRHSCLESFFSLQTPFKQTASCSPAWVCLPSAPFHFPSFPFFSPGPLSFFSLTFPPAQLTVGILPSKSLPQDPSLHLWCFLSLPLLCIWPVGQLF